MKLIAIIFSVVALCAVSYTVDAYAIDCKNAHCYALEIFRQYNINGIEYELQVPDLYIDRSNCLTDVVVSTGWFRTMENNREWGEAGVTKGTLQTFNAERECVSSLQTYYAYNTFNEKDEFSYVEILVPEGRVDPGDKIKVKIEKFGDTQIRFFIDTPERTTEFASGRIHMSSENVYYADFGIEGSVSGPDEYSSIPISKFSDIKIKNTADNWINLPSSGAPLATSVNEGYRIHECTDNSFVAGVVTSLGAADCNHIATRNQVPQVTSQIFNPQSNSPITINLDAVDTDKDYLKFNLVELPTSGYLNYNNKAQNIPNTDGDSARLVYTPADSPPESDSIRYSVTDSRNGHTKEGLISIIGAKSDNSIPDPIGDFSYTLDGTKVTLTWSHPHDGGSDITHYKVERSADTTSWQFQDTLSETITSLDVQRYEGFDGYYRIFALNDIGTSAASNVVHVHIDDTTPPIITIITPTNDQTLQVPFVNFDADVYESNTVGVENARITIDGTDSLEPISIVQDTVIISSIASTLTPLGNGEHTITVYADNRDGYTGNASVDILVSVPVSDTLTSFDEDFETDMSNWILTTGDDEYWSVRDSPRNQVPDSLPENKIGGTEDCDSLCSMTMVDRIDLTEMNEPTLSFYRYVSTSMDLGEGLTIFISEDDGDNWRILDSFTADNIEDDGNWHLEEYSLQDYSSNEFKLKFEAKSNSNSEDTELDNLRVFDSEPTLPDIPVTVTEEEIEIPEEEIESEVPIIYETLQKPIKTTIVDYMFNTDNGKLFAVTEYFNLKITNFEFVMSLSDEIFYYSANGISEDIEGEIMVETSDKLPNASIIMNGNMGTVINIGMVDPDIESITYVYAMTFNNESGSSVFKINEDNETTNVLKCPDNVVDYTSGKYFIMNPDNINECYLTTNNDVIVYGNNFGTFGTYKTD